MSNELSFPGRLLRLAVAGLLLATPVVGPLHHTGDTHPGPGYVGPEHDAASYHHDHAICLQLQSTNARPSVPPEAPAVPRRIVADPAPRSTTVGHLAWRSGPRARAPPRGAPA